MTATASPERTEPTDAPRTSRRGDRVFAGVVRGAALTILIALVAVFVFLAAEGWKGLTADASVYAPFTSFVSYIEPLIVSTLLASAIALVVSVPFAIARGAVHLPLRAAPARRRSLGYVIDLLAAVPSVVFGLWGGRYLAAYLQPAHVWLHDHFGFIPLFGEPSPNGRSLFTASIVLAIMILPIMTAISREVFLQTPRLHEEAALALGATRWEMIRYAVFPYARSGMVSGIMLGLGRALGETMAVAMVLATTPHDDAERHRHGEPADHRGQHRPELQRGDAGAAVAADRHRPGPVRGDVPGELRGALGRRPQCPEAGAMTAGTLHISHPRLPRWAPALVGVMALAVAGLPALVEGWSAVKWLVAAIAVFLVAMPLWSRLVEGRRAAVDRFVTALIWTSFAVAVSPLVWLLYVVIHNGLPAINAAVPEHLDAERDRGRAGRHLPRPDRDPADHRCRRDHLRADRHHDRDLPRGVRQDLAHGADHHLPRRRDDRHPVDRGGPVRPGVARAALRPRIPRGHRGLHRPVAADDPDRRPLLRGDDAAGSRRPPRGVVRARACRSGARSPASCCRRRSPASSPVSSWRSRA